MLTEDTIKEALKTVKYPGYSRDIVSFGLVKEIVIQGAAVNVRVQLTSGTPEVAQQLKVESERVLKALPGIKDVVVQVLQPSAGAAAPPNPCAGCHGRYASAAPAWA